MDCKGLGDLLAESSASVHEYVDMMQYATDPPMGISYVEVISYDLRGTYAVLHLGSRIPDTSGLNLLIDGNVIREADAGFSRYDEISKTIVIHPGSDVLDNLGSGDHCIRVFSDMKFLIESVMEFFRRYGSLISMPRCTPPGMEAAYDDGIEPSAEQSLAVHNILSNRLSYVWGAPGTGKTQFVLSACIRAYLDAGMKVAVFAPTNNAIEQVIEGILKSSDNGSDIADRMVRLGVPTRGFLSRHPGMCEDRQSQRRIDECLRSLDNLNDVMYERACDAVWSDIEELESAAEECHPEGKVLIVDNPRLSEIFDGIREFCMMREFTRDIPDMIGKEYACSIATLLKVRVFGRERPASDLFEYDDWSDSDILAEMISIEREIEALSSKDARVRIERANVIAGTPLQFISRFRPRGTVDDGRMELDVDHIFLDEAGYCGLVYAMSLFTNGVPVTFLGDHMQLPPVCELDEEVLRRGAEEGGSLKDAYLWNLSALYCESLLTLGGDGTRRMFLDSDPPLMSLTVRSDLTQSHRFGSNLALILDRFVYGNGMTGVGGSGLDIVSLDAVCTCREDRENTAEAETIRGYLEKHSPKLDDVVILTPYSSQVRLLRSVLGKYGDCVMTVHKSQGREWGTVILSVADNGIGDKDVPLRFTSSMTSIGMRVINTAVSRAKKRLVIVCDAKFWSELDGELINGILRDAVPEG